MLKNYIRVAMRNLRNHKTFSSINIIGLAVGIACCITIMLYVQDELSYDKFNTHADEIYRVQFRAYLGNKEVNQALTCAPLQGTLVKDFPQVVAATRIANFGSPVLRYKEKAFAEKRFYWADSTFFKVFTVNFIQGDPRTVLTQPNAVVISQAMANKYFGEENPVGKFLNADQRMDLVVTGVVGEFPHNSHFHFDFLASLVSIAKYRNDNDNWLSNNYYTYVMLHNGTDPLMFQKKLNDHTREYISTQLKAVMAISLDQYESSGNKIGYYLHPLTSIHLASHVDFELEPNSDISYVYIFSAIAVAILLIACINFMNLSTARSDRRAKEVGIRKTLGSSRTRLVAQFIAESITISLIAVFLAVGLVEIFLPVFNNISGKEVSLELFNNAYSVPLLFLFSIVVGIVAGSYPAFYLSSFLPIRVLKSGSRKMNRKSVLRSTLVIFQFTVSIALFIGTFIIYRQLHYMQEKDIGLNKDQVLIISKADAVGAHMEQFKQELSGCPGVVSSSNSASIPGSLYDNNVWQLEGGPSQDAEAIMTMKSDYEYAGVYKLEMIAGRFFSKDHPSDSAGVVLNETGVKALGLVNPLGKILIRPGNAPRYEIIGVMKDFNYESLHEKIRPLAVSLFDRGEYSRFVSVRVSPVDYQSTIAFLERTWEKYAGNTVFQCNFLDQNLQLMYEADQRAGKIAAIFSALAILIACLGLLGLAAFITEQRTKEIGVRKVLGASVVEVIALLSSEFVKWVLIANVAAWPLAYYVMNNWLQNFAYRVDISAWIFAAAGALALVVALATVSSHAIKAATANPVHSLRYE